VSRPAQPSDHPNHPDRHDPSRRPGRAGLLLVLSVAVNLALIAGLVYLFYIRPTPLRQDLTDPGPTPTQAPEAIVALGRVQPAGGVVSVFGPPGDRVVKLKVDLASTVKVGDILVELSGQAERELNIQALDAQLREAETLRASITRSRDARLADLKVETEQAIERARADIEAADAQIVGLDAQLRQARAERKRLADVEARGVRVSEQEKAQADLAVTQAEQLLAAARAQRRAAELVLATAPDAAEAKRAAIEAESERALAQVPFESLKASRQAAAQRLEDAAMKAPVSGRVVNVLARPGDTLTNQPVLQIADTEQMTVVAEVYETDVARLREWLQRGPVPVEVDARVLGVTAQPLRGTVTPGAVAPMIARGTVFALGPREDADRRVVEVEVRLDPASSAAVRDFIGLQVRTRFLPPGK
jgi:HlyD family secretion protein